MLAIELAWEFLRSMSWQQLVRASELTKLEQKKNVSRESMMLHEAMISPLYTVPKEPDPILGPMRISLASMFQSSPVWICSRGDKILLLSSADRARWRRFTCFNVFVGDACVEWECSQYVCKGIGLLALARIFWSPQSNGFRTLLTHTLGAEFDRFSKLSVFGCLMEIKFVINLI